MTNNNLLMYGAIAVGAIYLYNRYTKKETPQGEEPQGGGGGGGGGGGFFPITPTPNVVVIGGVKQPTTPTNPVVLAGLGGAKPVVVVSASSTGYGATQNAGTNTGITGIGGTTGTGTTTTSGTTSGSGTSMTTTQGGNVFTPFDGYSANGGMSLDNLVRSWNRP